MTNLKRLMMELGNELVINYGADPHTDPRCKAIQNLMDELNKWGGFMEDSDESLRGGLELAEVAEKLDFKWPVLNESAANVVAYYARFPEQRPW